jgi:hypothetical protein
VHVNDASIVQLEELVLSSAQDRVDTLSGDSLELRLAGATL